MKALEKVRCHFFLKFVFVFAHAEKRLRMGVDISSAQWFEFLFKISIFIILHL